MVLFSFSKLNFLHFLHYVCIVLNLIGMSFDNMFLEKSIYIKKYCPTYCNEKDSTWIKRIWFIYSKIIDTVIGCIKNSCQNFNNYGRSNVHTIKKNHKRYKSYQQNKYFTISSKH